MLTDEQVERIAEAITKVAHGDVSGPAGLEACAMMNLEGLKEVAASLDGVANALWEIAGAIRASRC